MLKGDFPNLSMGTVYRNLAVLIEQGEIEKIDFGSTFDRFDGTIGEHYHFICENCGKIVDIDIPVDRELNNKVRRSTPYDVNRHRIEFYGMCDECK